MKAISSREPALKTARVGVSIRSLMNISRFREPELPNGQYEGGIRGRWHRGNGKFTVKMMLDVDQC